MTVLTSGKVEFTVRKIDGIEGEYLRNKKSHFAKKIKQILNNRASKAKADRTD